MSHQPIRIKMIAVSDVHAPRYFPLMSSSINSLLGFKPDLVLLGGDIVEKGNVGSFDIVRRFLRNKYGDVDIVSIFGNEEYFDRIGDFKTRYKDVIWLDDSYVELVKNGLKICIYGSRGSLEKLTSWQSRNMPQLKEIYRRRLVNIKNELKSLKNRCDITILLMHYSPTYQTLKGEPLNIYPYLGHRGFEKVIAEAKPDLVLHGHAHGSLKHEAYISGVPVFNIALPAVKSVTRITMTYSGKERISIIREI